MKIRNLTLTLDCNVFFFHMLSGRKNENLVKKERENEKVYSFIPIPMDSIWEENGTEKVSKMDWGRVAEVEDTVVDESSDVALEEWFKWCRLMFSWSAAFSNASKNNGNVVEED